MKRRLSVVNSGTETVYRLRIGHHDAGSWSEDLLEPTQVVDVGDARTLSVSLDQTCWYDVRAEYRDGHVAEIDDLDLCAEPRLFLKH